ncbi:PAS domain-containing protein, partial [Mycobacterium tuberculosis]|nr:PAS domain-containing protein [Mycobacterium tuberculosis]
SNITVSEQDADLRYTWVYNPPPGMDAAEMVGALPSDLFPDDSGRQLMATKQRVLESGRPERVQTSIVIDGGTVWFDERI